MCPFPRPVPNNGLNGSSKLLAGGSLFFALNNAKCLFFYVSGVKVISEVFRDTENLAYIVEARSSEFQEFIGDSQPFEYLEFLSVQARFIYLS